MRPFENSFNLLNLHSITYSQTFLTIMMKDQFIFAIANLIYHTLVSGQRLENKRIHFLLFLDLPCVVITGDILPTLPRVEVSENYPVSGFEDQPQAKTGSIHERNLAENWDWFIYLIWGNYFRKSTLRYFPSDPSGLLPCSNYHFYLNVHVLDSH